MRLLNQETRLAFVFATANTANNVAIKLAMTVVTASNSIKVKARLCMHSSFRFPQPPRSEFQAVENHAIGGIDWNGHRVCRR